ncbi:hypothetical protein [Candidatus Spyradosoma sp. SGI.093]|uniref:hypothetical protein n=1 Tax=Candidatus Spyradosoma sp. SGI.093 TaxID=3420583 RepID=UPI003CFC4D8F
MSASARLTPLPRLTSTERIFNSSPSASAGGSPSSGAAAGGFGSTARLSSGSTDPAACARCRASLPTAVNVSASPVVLKHRAHAPTIITLFIIA